MHAQELNITGSDVFELLVQRRVSRDDKRVTLFIVDMSGVKKLFVRSGRLESSTFLRNIAQMLLRMCRDDDQVCRIGDFTFGVLLDGVDSDVRQQLVAEKIIRLYNAAMGEADIAFEGGVAVGIASFPANADSASDLINKASIALEAAESSGDPYRVYSPDSLETMSIKWAIQDDLTSAIENRNITVQYQPQVCAKTGRPLGAEALARWEHPSHGRISPSVFIPLACDTGLIKELTNFVLSQAVRDATQWPDVLERQSISVNVEAPLLQSPDIRSMVSGALSIWNDDRVDLTLEITEQTLMVESASNFTRLTELRKLDVGLAIDDFGTGYSSLSQFRDLPASELKIDRSFTANLADSKRNRSLVQTIISLAHGFGLKTVAEGVESQEDLDILVEMGCEVVQGYFVSKPLSHEAYCKWLVEAARGRAG